MPKLYRGREWSWWIVLNSHNCGFCREQNRHISLGGIVRRKYGLCQVDRDYWKRLYQVWLAHMKEYHPQILRSGKLRGRWG